VIIRDNNILDRRLDRREFIKVISSLAAGLHLPVFSKNADLNKSDKFGDLLPTRALGNTGKQITMLGVVDLISAG